MSETSKMPFEPIPMPGMPEMPKPSFSRSTTPPQSAPPITRKPLMIADDKPDSFFLPNGIAPEALKSPPTMTAEVKPSGFPLSWLKPSRAKGVVLAGLGSLGIGAFGLNALVPVPVSEPMKANTFADTASLPPSKPKPQIELEREDKLPEILPVPIGSNDPLPVPLLTPVISGEFKQVGATLPVIKPLDVPGVPPIIPATIPMIPEQLKSEGLPPLPSPGALGSVPLSPPALTGLPLPGSVEQEKELLPLVLPSKPPRTPSTPAALPSAFPAVETTLPSITAPIPPLPVPNLTSITPTATPKPNIELRPFPEAPAPLPVTALPGKPVATAPTEAKTDYDVDIHKIRAGDTYVTISQRYYDTANFANQLRTYNENADLSRAQDVQVPPMYVIKKFGTGRGAEPTGVVPAGTMQNPAPLVPADLEWISPSARKNGNTEKTNDGQPPWR